VWLWFWLKEDAKRPEPKRLLFAAFAAGMIAVPFALSLEKFAVKLPRSARWPNRPTLIARSTLPRIYKDV